MAKAEDVAVLDVAGRSVRITNPGKVFFPERGASTREAKPERTRAIDTAILAAPLTRSAAPVASHGT